MRLFLIGLLAYSIHVYSQQDIRDQVKPIEQLSFLRPYLEPYREKIKETFGEKWELKILGKTEFEMLEDQIVLPNIPEVKDAVTSTDVYNKKADKVKLSEKDEAKFFKTFVRDLYYSVRRQDATEEEMQKYVMILLQGGSREGIYRSLVLDSVYAQMEGYDLNANQKVSEFASEVYEKYLGKKVKTDKIRSLNFYSIKRLLTERSLEVIDAYGEDRDAIEKWYAILSSDLAKKFSSKYSNKLRKNELKTTHLKWAKTVPVQHIKSEVIIKLHIGLNSLISD